jgi:hypothetical protein
MIDKHVCVDPKKKGETYEKVNYYVDDHAVYQSYSNAILLKC